MKQPANIELCSVAYYAGNMAQNATAAYWCEGHEEAEHTSQHLRKTVVEDLEKIAEIFGMELVEIEREPEPLDAETVAQRDESYRRQMIDAGRGGQLGG